MLPQRARKDDEYLRTIFTYRGGSDIASAEATYSAGLSLKELNFLNCHWRVVDSNRPIAGPPESFQTRLNTKALESNVPVQSMQLPAVRLAIVYVSQRCNLFR